MLSSSQKPAGFGTVTPYLSIKDADKAISFYEKVLGAKQTSRLEHADGKIMHATIQIGDSTIMLAESCGQMQGPNELGGFRDPFGHIWSVAKHIEDVSEDEIKRRAREMFKDRKAA